MAAGPPAVVGGTFPKRYRLLKTDDFSSVFAFRRALKSAHFLLHYRPREVMECPAARLGLVVAKRYLRRSIDRNLVRRLAREHFRLMHARLKECDLILRLAVKPGPLDRRALAREIEELLRRMTRPEQ